MARSRRRQRGRTHPLSPFVPVLDAENALKVFFRCRRQRPPDLVAGPPISSPAHCSVPPSTTDRRVSAARPWVIVRKRPWADNPRPGFLPPLPPASLRPRLHASPVRTANFDNLRLNSIAFRVAGPPTPAPTTVPTGHRGSGPKRPIAVDNCRPPSAAKRSSRGNCWPDLN